jgi:hypothetical protein
MRLQQGFASGEMGFPVNLQQRSWDVHVRFGSKADLAAQISDVRFAPESGHC